ncbi:hypothetical protein CBR_g8854 [Chara braunii]|uniref:Uncharacterized protein n=1 Tax=Chara braunii TaxID=69332 RepID=A0A388KN34_CHABU|nr:hypothetical protein CBR_g8854 [Chara braunii]|eukprot:GBG71435.1 hypothetical protein CBR_g8854 [Chara braunii]
MDNARVCVKAGKMVEAAYPTIFIVDCTAHALDLALEDMYKEMPWMAQVVDAGNKSLKELRNALDCCVCDSGWVDKMVRNDQLLAMHEVTTIVLDKGDFWSNMQKALHVMQPVVELLRLVDGQGATISKVYCKMDRVVQDLRALEWLSDEVHEAVERILMRRWAFLTSQLHCTAAFLDPEHRMHTADHDPEAREQANHKPPTLWWEALSSKPDFLAPQAIKLLGQASSYAACEQNWSLHELIYGRRRTKFLPERMAKLVYISWNVRLLRRIQRGDEDDTHIPWADDVPVDKEMEDKEMEEWYVQWLERVNEDVDRKEAVEVDFDDDGDEIPMRRTFMRNDEDDDKLVEEEETELVGTRQRDWHECTKPAKHREQELRKRSGCQLPEPGELYTEAGYALAMEARQTGTWVQGRDEAPRKRSGKGKGKQTVVDDDPPAQSGKRKIVQHEQPPPKRGRPTLAEQATRKAQEAEDKVVAAAAAAAAAKAAADKAAKAKDKAAAKAATKSAGGGKAKNSVVVSDNDDLDVPEGSPKEDEPEGSSTSSDSSSSSAASSSQSSGSEGTDGDGSEGGAQFEEDEEEDRAEAE